MMQLGTKTSLRLFRVLLEDPLNEFKEIELIKKAKTGKGSASSIINNLVKEGILLERRAGKTKIISLNLQNQSVFLLKSLFDREKMVNLSKSRLASILSFLGMARQDSELLLIFGSSITKTADEKSDIDVLVVSSNIGNIQEAKKKTEELFGERLNLHFSSKDEIKGKIRSDGFLRNALLKGVLIYGYDFAIQLFSSLNQVENLDRLLFFNERIKSAIRNYSSKDYETAKDILENTLEQMTYYILSKKGISYTSKKDAAEQIDKTPEGKNLKAIKKAKLDEKINLIEKFILSLLQTAIIQREGYVK